MNKGLHKSEVVDVPPYVCYLFNAANVEAGRALICAIAHNMHDPAFNCEAAEHQRLVPTRLSDEQNQHSQARKTTRR
jgi:hypothetical protein